MNFALSYLIKIIAHLLHIAFRKPEADRKGTLKRLLLGFVVPNPLLPDQKIWHLIWCPEIFLALYLMPNLVPGKNFSAF